MATGLAIFSMILVLLSVYGVLHPFSLILLVRGFIAGSGPWGAVVTRIILAFLLWFSAPLSHTPTALQTLAILALVAAFILPIIGTQRILKIMETVESWPHPAIRLLCLLGVGFGGFLLWSIAPFWAPT